MPPPCFTLVHVLCQVHACVLLCIGSGWFSGASTIPSPNDDAQRAMVNGWRNGRKRKDASNEQRRKRQKALVLQGAIRRWGMYPADGPRGVAIERHSVTCTHDACVVRKCGRRRKLLPCVFILYSSDLKHDGQQLDGLQRVDWSRHWLAQCGDAELSGCRSRSTAAQDGTRQ